LLFLTGEEVGLLGSDAWVAHPPASLPLSAIAGVINLDAGAPPAPPTTWRIAGDSSSLQATAVAVGEATGWTITTSPATPNSDYFPFVRHGIDAIFIIPGPGPYEGFSATQSDSLRSVWDRYHRADDEWAPDFPFSGLARYAGYALRIVLAAENAGN
jgi:Zn-dependent M28 family amino/carboxypeptidase